MISGDDILPLRLDCLTSPGPCDLAAVAATMLWPSDSEKTMRDAYTDAVAFETMIETANHPQPADMAPSARRAFYDRVRFGARPSDFADEIKKAIERGHITGHIFYNVVSTAAVNGKPASLTASKQFIESWYQQFRRPPHGKKFSRSTIEQIWAHFKPVAPYWSSRFTFGEDYAAQNPFPCAIADLGKFLAIANELRERGENTYPPQSPGRTLVVPGETYRVNPLIELPCGALRFERAAS